MKRRKLKLADGVWRYRIGGPRGEWWDRRVVVTLWTPAGRQVLVTSDELGFTNEFGPSPAVTPGILRAYIERTSL